MSRDPRFDVVRERADQAIDQLAQYLPELDRAIAAARAELDAVVPWPKVHYKYTRCSANCTCNGGRGHGPYAYASVSVEGRAHKQYLGKNPGIPENAVDKATYNRLERRYEALCAERERLWEQIGQALSLLETPAAQTERAALVAEQRPVVPLAEVAEDAAQLVGAS